MDRELSYESYGQTLAGGNFFKNVGHWFSDHKGAIAAGAGGLAFLAAQAIPGLDVAVDTAAASDLATTTAESADAAEDGSAAAKAVEGGEDGAPKGKRWANPRRRAFAGNAKFVSKGVGGVGAMSLGGEMLQNSSGAPPATPPPAYTPPPNMVGAYSAPTSGNPYLS
jgi:hypothetical protein